MESKLEPCQIADALEKCDWAGASIGNKAIVSLAIEALRNNCRAPAAMDTRLGTIGYAQRGTIGLLMEGAVDGAVIVPKPGGDFETPVVMRENADELSAEKDVIIRSHLTTIASLEAKLAAAEKALETADTAVTLADKLIERGYGSDTPREWHKVIVAAQKARAVLGGGPEGRKSEN